MTVATHYDQASLHIAEGHDEEAPLVIVEGFLGSTGSILWGKFEDYLNGDGEIVKEGRRRRKVVFARVGPVSSLHDRACELYYAVKGGQVDYGEEHARLHVHGRHGRSLLQGLYPEWSVANPLHLLGHSMGGATIVKLQDLLKHKYFGEGSHPDMILSISTISAPFRGTQLVYSLGERTDAAPLVRPLSVGSLLAKVVHVASYLAPLMPPALDMLSDSRNLSFRHASVLTLFRQLWKRDWAESRDATPFDVTFEAADEREANGEGVLCPQTYYRSHVACMTEREPAGSGNDLHVPSCKDAFTYALYLSSGVMGQFDFSTLRPAPSFAIASSHGRDDVEQAGERAQELALGEEYWANDGVVPIFSQWHPLPCQDTKCRHLSDTSARDLTNVAPEPGIWHVYHERDASHISVVPFWMATERQCAFWKDLGCWLRSIERHRRQRV